MNKNFGVYSAFKHVACNLCGNDNAAILGRKGYFGHNNFKNSPITVDIVRCKRCGLIYANPMPIPINKHRGFSCSDFDSMLFIEQRKKGHIFNLEKIETLISKGKILDVGCGKGDFVKIASDKGWVTYAVEVDPELCEYVSAFSNVFCGFLEDAMFPNRFFDVVYLNSVLEHVYDPKFLLGEANRIMKEGSILCIETPNEESLVKVIGDFYFRIRGGKYSTRLSPFYKPFHVYGFSKKTLSNMIKKRGFDILEVNVTPGKNDFPSSASCIKKLEKGIRGMVVFIGGVVGMGQVLTLFARKK